MGEWYVSAYCHRANDERMFRVDRIRALRATGERFEARSADDEIAEVFHPHADDPRVTLELAPSAAWVTEAYPAESTTTRTDGTIEVVLAVSEPAWLERLLVRLGPEVRVLGPDSRTQGRRRGRTACPRPLQRDPRSEQRRYRPPTEAPTLPRGLSRAAVALTRSRALAHERMTRWSRYRAVMSPQMRADRPARRW